MTPNTLQCESPEFIADSGGNTENRETQSIRVSSRTKLLLVLLCGVALAGCRNKEQERENAALQESLRNLSGQIAAVKGDNEGFKRTIDEQRQNLAKLEAAKQALEAEKKAEEDKKNGERIAATVADQVESFAHNHYADHRNPDSIYKWKFDNVEVINTRPTQAHSATAQVTIKISARAVGMMFENNVYGYPTSTFQLYFDDEGKLMYSESVSNTK